MASNLRVDTILPSTGTSLGIGTANGSITVNGSVNSLNVSGNLGVGGVLTYEDVTNIDSVGVITARNGVKTNVSPAITIRDGSTEKGFIGFNGNDPFIGRKNGVGLLFQNNKIRPVDGDDGSGSNNTVDIGEPTYKFKDGYFAGNLVIGTAGKGIDYSAQTATSASGATATGEVLVHYEEGTWTPNLTTSNGGTYNASHRYGYYTRIGRMVHAHFVFNSYGAQLTDLRGSGSDNDVVLGSGLPFPTTNNGQEYYCSDMGFWAVNFPGSLSQGSMFMYAYINANSSEWSFWLPSDNAGGAQLKVQQFGQAYIRGCFHYLTS